MVRLKLNDFSLYDMHGNVFEWCCDYYEADYDKLWLRKDPTDPRSGSFRVLRGGSWGNYASPRSARRNWNVAGNRNYVSAGFRVVRELD